MAGKEEPSNGEAWAADGVRIGYLEQEPQLGLRKPLPERNRWHGCEDMDRFNAISLAEPMDDDEMNNLLTGRAAGTDRCRRRLGARTHC